MRRESDGWETAGLEGRRGGGVEAGWRARFAQPLSAPPPPAAARTRASFCRGRLGLGVVEAVCAVLCARARGGGDGWG